MPVEAGSILLYQLLPGSFIIGLLCVMLRCKKPPGSPLLSVPLLSGDTVEHRVDAATRDALAGYTVCAGCEFANFRRAAYCCLCGERLPVDSQPSDVPACGETPTHARQLRTQQIRVRGRKEWTRKLGVDGALFWYRAGSRGATPADTGYCVVFEPRAERAGADQPGESSVETVVVGATRVEVSADADLRVVAASEADAAVFPTGGRLQPATEERRREVMELAARDFPSKYAHFVVSTAALIVPAELVYLKLSVQREYLLEQSIDHVSCIQEKNIHSYMRIAFLDESGVDAGGVHREWFMLVNELLLAPALRLFVCTNPSEQTFYLNPHSAHDVGEDHLAYYFAAGRLVGRALLEGGVWGFHLSLPLVKIILGIPVSLGDLAYFDPEAHRGLVWLLEHDGTDALGLDFSVTERRADGELVVVDLVENGRDVPVTDANKRAFVERKWRYLLFESVSSQLYVFLKGLYEVIPQELLMIFDAEEFDYLLCGTQEIDVDDWKASTVITDNLNGLSVVRWFWEVVREMPNEYRRRLLLFATGSSRVPLSGFAGLTSYDGRLCPFTLKGVPYHSTQYISSHACFNRLDLPLYRSKRELKAVLLATLETDQYGFTTA